MLEFFIELLDGADVKFFLLFAAGVFFGVVGNYFYKLLVAKK